MGTMNEAPKANPTYKFTITHKSSACVLYFANYFSYNIKAGMSLSRQ